MSAKDFEGKTELDDNSESGFVSESISCPISEQFSSEVHDTIPTIDSSSDNKNVQSCQEADSGAVDCLTEEIGEIDIGDSITTQQTRTIPVHTTKDIPPLNILYEQDDDGDTQVHIAAVHGCEKSISLLINRCPNKAWLDIPNDYRHTPLHLAVLCRHPKIARMLVYAGASLKTRDLAGETPLHIATRLNNVECVHALLRPVSNRRIDPDLVLNQKNYDGQTCAHLAATSGNLEMIRTLMHYKVDMNVREGHGGWTALHIAARRGDGALVRHLAGSALVAAGARDYAGRSAARIARAYHSHLADCFSSSYDESDSDDQSDEDESDPEEFYESLVRMRSGQQRLLQAA